MKRRIAEIMIVLVVLFLSVWALSGFIFLVLSNAVMSLEVYWQALQQSDVLLFAFSAFVLVAIALFITMRPQNRKSVVKANDLENSRFMNSSDIRKSKALRKVRYSKLKKVRIGIPLAIGKKVLLAEADHTLVIGSTGSGKTTAVLAPTIQVLSCTETKPSFIVADPKGELFRLNSEHLQEQGYRIQQIDLGAGIFTSSRWNPFDIIFHKIKRIIELKSDDADDDADSDKSVDIARLENEVYQDMQDTIYTCFPIRTTNEDAFWENGARDLIFAVGLAFCEDVEEGYMSHEQFTLFNLKGIIVEGTGDECKALKEYFSGRRPTSKAVPLSKQVLDTSGAQLSSYITTVHSYLNFLNDTGVTTLTSSSDISFERFDEEPSALFLRIPDERDTRYKIAAVLVQTAYKQLVTKAADNVQQGKTTKNELLRDVLLLLEEFGNLPKMTMVDKIITAGRGRKIWFYGVIQDYAQISNLYGNKIADIIKSNCNIKAFIGSTDKKTIEEISNLCGKTKIAVSGHSENHKSETSTSVSVRERPVIYASELERLNRKGNYGNAVVLYFGHYPLKSKFAPTFSPQGKRLYTIGCIEDFVGNTKVFDESMVIYTVDFREAVNKTEQNLSMGSVATPKAESSGLGQIDILSMLEDCVSSEKLAELRTSEDLIASLAQLRKETKHVVVQMRIQEVIEILKGVELCKKD